MRYLSIPTITFIDINNIQHSIKDIRPIPSYSTGIEIKVEQDMFIDEVISRKDFYDNGAESLSYTVVDNNIEKMVENNFDISKMKKLKIPIID